MTELKNVADIFDGTHQTPEYKDSGIPFVSVENIDDIYNYNKFISIDAYTKEFSKNHPEQNDILMTRIGDIGTPAFVTRSEDMGYYVSLALLKPKNINNKYLYYYIQTSYFQHELWKKTIHVAFPKKINKEDIGDCKIFLPNLIYQDQIVELFDKLEARIIAQKKIIEEYKLLKKGICDDYHKIDCNKFRIKELGTIGRGRVINSNEISHQNNPKYPIYSSQTLNNGIMGYLDEYDFDGEYITWTTDGANAGTVFYHNEKFNCTNVCGTIKVTNNIIDPFYLSLVLQYECKKYVSMNLANPKLMNNTMALIEVKVPSITYQKRIIQIVKVINKKIIDEEKILSLLEKQKQYLLNKMFI